MTALVRYEAARQALAEAHRVDEVKNIRDKAQAMAAYARQAKDTALVEWATEIKVRAERRAGEMLRESAERGERATPNGNVNPRTKVSNDATPTLSDLGISRDQSSRWQKLAAIPEQKFEHAVAAAKETAREVTTAALLRLRREDAAPRSRGTTSGKGSRAEPAAQSTEDRLLAKIAELQEALAEAADEVARLTAIKGGDADANALIKNLQAELRAVKAKRDDLMRENAQMRAQIKILQRKAK